MLERTDPVNHTSLKWMAVSPRHYLHYLKNPPEDTEAFLLGRVTHCAIYEMDQLSSRYLPEPRFNRTMRDENALAAGYDGGKEAAKAFAERAASLGCEVVKRDLFERALAMAKALHADPIASQMIVGGYSEQLISWIDEKTGIECRGRVDHIASRLTDLKTTRCIEPRAFANQAVRLLYHSQMAYYLDGLRANGVQLDDPPAIIAVENEAPYDVAVFEFTEADIEAGRRVYRACLDRLAECRRTDTWPGVSNGTVQRIALPEWAMPDLELTMGGISLDV